MNLNIKQIKSLANNNLTFEKGIDYYESGKVTNFQIERGREYLTLTAVVLGKEGRKYNVEVIILTDNTVKTKCECLYSDENKVCKHVIALLLAFYYHKEDKTEKNNEVETDAALTKLISHYSKQHYHDNFSLASNRKVNLIPILERNYQNNLYLNLLIGIDKMYVIKNMQKFYTDLKTESIVEYGKNLTICHNFANFTEESQALMMFFLSTYGNYYFYSELNRYNSSENRILLLSPSAIDDFFDLYINKQITFKNHSYETMIKFTIDPLYIVMSIKPHNDESFKVDLNLKNILIFSGQHFEYYLSENKLHRVPLNYYEKLDFLIKSMTTKGNGLIIRKQDLRLFFTNVVDEIKDIVSIDVEQKVLEEYAPIPLSAKLYLDADPLITGKLKFSYNDEEFDAEQSEITPNSVRNFKEENYLKTLVNRFFEYYDKNSSTFYCTDDDYIYNLYDEGLEVLGKRLQVFATDKFKNRFRKLPNINIGVKMKHDLLSVDINIDDYTLEELFAILSSYRHKKRYHRLKDGSFIKFHEEDMEVLNQFTEMVEATNDGLENEITLPKYRALYIDNLLKQGTFIKSEKDNEFKKTVRDILSYENNDFHIPDTLNNILRNYQKVGFYWLKTISLYGFGGILADDMGLGKTLEIISLLLSYKEETSDVMPSLVVSPSSLVLNWQMEIAHFAKELKVLTIIGNYEQRKELFKNINDYDVVLTSYDYLKRDIEFYDDYQFMYHVIDEAQYIKNNTTLNAKSVKRIKSTCRFALTGTPIENSLAEIWSIFDFIMPGYLYSYKKFQDKYEIEIVRNENEKAVEQLKRIVTPFVLRRLKKDVLQELPEKTLTTMYVELAPEQKKLYNANLLKIKLELDERLANDELGNNKILILSMLTRLRQICCDPLLYYDDYKGESAKREMCLELIQSSKEANHKILLFSQFTSMLAILSDELSKLGISYYLLEGKTPKEERLRLVDAFNNDNTTVFLISLKAGGTGLNLTGADVVIHYDPWWNISAENQATDRTHRIGQKNNVQVYKLITKDTIEEKILKMQESKIKLAESIVVSDDGVIANMSVNEIIDLFND